MGHGVMKGAITLVVGDICIFVDRDEGEFNLRGAIAFLKLAKGGQSTMSCDGLGDTNGNNVMFVFDEVKWYRRE